MTILTEGPHAGEAILSEAGRQRSRDPIVVIASQTLLANQIIGRTASAATVGAAAAGAGNTGNGTVALGNPAFSGTVQPGVYRITFVEPVTNLGTFVVEGPDGIMVGRGVVGTAFAGPINFTVSDGATDFVSGDTFTITVTAVTYRWGAFDPAATDGRQVPRAMIFDAVTTGVGVTARAVALTRACELNGKKLQWLTGLTGTQIATATETLNASPVGITIRP